MSPEPAVDAALPLTAKSGWWTPWQQLTEQSLTHWQQFGEQLQSSELLTLKQLIGDAHLQAQEAQGVSQPSDLISLQSTLMAEASARLVALSEQGCSAWLEFQSHCWRDVEALLAAALNSWQDNASRLNAGSAAALMCPPEHPNAAALIEAATQAIPLATSAMLNALNHDLQQAAAPGTTQH